MTRDNRMAKVCVRGVERGIERVGKDDNEGTRLSNEWQELSFFFGKERKR